jgi:hypothetical protein
MKLGMTAFKIIGPIALVGLLAWGHKRAVNGAYDDGKDSRDAEVQTLTNERDVALLDVETLEGNVLVLEGDLLKARNAKAQVEAEVGSLKSKILAQADENAKALRLQAQGFASTQSVTLKAMDTLARNTKASDIDFAAILEQLKGVEYGYDQTSGKCIIRGGGRVLRNAAKGKVGN